MTSAAPAEAEGPRWGRVLLKLSGEAFAGGEPLGIDPVTVSAIGPEAQAAVDAIAGLVADKFNEEGV